MDLADMLELSKSIQIGGFWKGKCWKIVCTIERRGKTGTEIEMMA